MLAFGYLFIYLARAHERKGARSQSKGPPPPPIISSPVKRTHRLFLGGGGGPVKVNQYWKMHVMNPVNLKLNVRNNE